MNHLDVYDPLMVTFLLFLPVLNHPLPLELFVYLRLITGILSLLTFAELTLLSLSNPILNLTFSLLPIMSSHPHASASDSTFDYWRYINIWLTLTLLTLCCSCWEVMLCDLCGSQGTDLACSVVVVCVVVARRWCCVTRVALRALILPVV